MTDATDTDAIDAQIAPANGAPILSLAPNPALLAAGTCAAASLSFIALPWPIAIASTLLALLMIAGADVDARTFLLPDIVTYGALLSGLFLLPACRLGGGSPHVFFDIGEAALRAAGMAATLYGLRALYLRLRGIDGVGLGDVKLAGAVGAWLPLPAIPYCFLLATGTALLFVLIKTRRQNRLVEKVPFGAFLCPALWFVYFAISLPR